MKYCLSLTVIIVVYSLFFHSQKKDDVSNCWTLIFMSFLCFILMRLRLLLHFYCFIMYFYLLNVRYLWLSEQFLVKILNELSKSLQFFFFGMQNVQSYFCSANVVFIFNFIKYHNPNIYIIIPTVFIELQYNTVINFVIENYFVLDFTM